MATQNSLLYILANSLISTVLFLRQPLPEDARLNFTGLGVKYGHKVEEHNVVTEDGYILTLFHIPGPRKPPVLLLHGLGDTADSFIIRGNGSLAITLANAGHDVWAANARGNRYARQHVELNPDKDQAFWDFSFHEHGYYDLPATVDYILNATGEESLQSIGHSQGTTSHFVLSSTRPEYNEKFKLFIALAPSAFLSNVLPPVSLISAIGPGLNWIFSSEIQELFNEKGAERKLAELVCNQGPLSNDLCNVGWFLLTGFDAKRLEPDFIPIAIGHYPSSTSRKSLLHYNQLIERRKFARFDYGPEENLKRYNDTIPPDYNLKLMTMKTALFVGKNDFLSRVKDVEYLKSVLPNVVLHHVMQPKSWNHNDFVWSNDMPKTLFPRILPLLDKYS